MSFSILITFSIFFSQKEQEEYKQGSIVLKQEEGGDYKEEVLHKILFLIIEDEKRKSTKGIVRHPLKMHQKKNLGRKWKYM